MKWATEDDFFLKCIRENKAFAAVTPTTELSGELRRLASAPTIAPSSVYANACRDAHLEIERLREALEKVRSYNVDIAAGRINYRPHDHIQVIDEAISPAVGKSE